MEDVVPSFGGGAAGGDAVPAIGGLAGLPNGRLPYVAIPAAGAPITPNGPPGHGQAGVPQLVGVAGLANGLLHPVPNGSGGFPALISPGQQLSTVVDRDEIVEDELINCASVDKVQEVTEQIAEFLVNFAADEQLAILAPFLADPGADGGVASADGGWPGADSSWEPGKGGGFVEPHIDEAQRFIWNYLAVYSQCERDIILEQWRTGRPGGDNASTSSGGHSRSITPPISVTPPISLTPPGSVTPTAVTPREFLSARREVNETYHGYHSPAQDHP